MPTKIAHISWTDSPSSVGTLVEYRVEGTANWIAPTVPTNPTPVDYYDLEIESGVIYDVRISSILTSCGPIYRYFTLFIPATDCCPEGFSMAPDGSYCYFIEEVAATPPTTVENAVAKQYPSYSTCGTWIYEAGYNVNGTGVSHQIPPANTFWVNGAGACVDATTTNGPLNRTGLWSETILNNQDIGFGICVNITHTKTYLIGLGTDNLGIIKVDGQEILRQDPTALGAQYSIGTLAAFKVWHIYPVTLTAGPHFIEVLGHNEFGPATLGCEIYDATPEELIAAVSYLDLGDKLLFSSKDQRNKPIQIGTDGVGYSCPAGFSVASCSDPIVCQKVITAPCTSSTTTTSTTQAPLCCPPDHILSEDGTYCYQFIEVPATAPTDPQITVPVHYYRYGESGTIIYNEGYNIFGNGSYTQVPLSNAFWTNIPKNNTDGPVNRNALWSAITFTDVRQTIGYTFCLPVPETKIYYIGVAFDNEGQISIDSNIVLKIDPNTQFSNFYRWAVYPILLQAGQRVIEIIGINTPGPVPNPGAIAFEVYDNTKEEIEAATSYIGLNCLYRSQDYIGELIEVGSQGFGYSCPVNYSLSACELPPVCRTRSITSLVPCGTTTTTSSTTTTTTTVVTCPTIADFSGNGFNDEGGSTVGNVRYGTLSDGDTPTSIEILAGTSVSKDVAVDVGINWGVPPVEPTFYWFAIPALSADALKNKWFQAVDNQGNMLSTDDTFNIPASVLVGGVLHYVYITMYATQFLNDEYIFGKA